MYGGPQHQKGFLLFVFVFVLALFAYAFVFVFVFFIFIGISMEQYRGHRQAPKGSSRAFCCLIYLTPSLAANNVMYDSRTHVIRYVFSRANGSQICTKGL